MPFEATACAAAWGAVRLIPTISPGKRDESLLPFTSVDEKSVERASHGTGFLQDAAFQVKVALPTASNALANTGVVLVAG